MKVYLRGTIRLILRFIFFPFFSLNERPVSGRGSKTFLTVWGEDKGPPVSGQGHCNGVHDSKPVLIPVLLADRISSRPESVCFDCSNVVSFFPLATELLLFFYANVVGCDVTASPYGKGNKQ